MNIEQNQNIKGTRNSQKRKRIEINNVISSPTLGTNEWRQLIKLLRELQEEPTTETTSGNDDAKGRQLLTRVLKKDPPAEVIEALLGAYPDAVCFNPIAFFTACEKNVRINTLKPMMKQLVKKTKDDDQCPFPWIISKYISLDGAKMLIEVHPEGALKQSQILSGYDILDYFLLSDSMVRRFKRHTFDETLWNKFKLILLAPQRVTGQFEFAPIQMFLHRVMMNADAIFTNRTKAAHILFLLYTLRRTDQWVFQKKSKDGKYPLHVLITEMCTVPDAALPVVRDMMSILIDAYPDSVNQRLNGKLPLQLATANHCPLENQDPVTSFLNKVESNTQQRQRRCPLARKKNTNHIVFSSPTLGTKDSKQRIEVLRNLKEELKTTETTHDNDDPKGQKLLITVLKNNSSLQVIEELLRTYPDAVYCNPNAFFTACQSQTSLKALVPMMEQLKTKNDDYCPFPWIINNNMTLKGAKLLIDVYPEGVLKKSQILSGYNVLDYFLLSDNMVNKSSSTMDETLYEKFKLILCAAQRCTGQLVYSPIQMFLQRIMVHSNKIFTNSIMADHILWLLNELRDKDQVLFEKKSMDGKYPLHFLITQMCTIPNEGIAVARNIIRILIQAYPDSVKESWNGQSSLHIAVENRWQCHDLLLAVHPEARLIQDPVTGLYPFQVAKLVEANPNVIDGWKK